LRSEIKEIYKYGNGEHRTTGTYKSKDGTYKAASYKASDDFHEAMMDAKSPSVINRRAF
jgi:hypothetical protein